ncbi:MAG: TVP38/TMEM64 family protein [Acidiphilium sp.]
MTSVIGGAALLAAVAVGSLFGEQWSGAVLTMLERLRHLGWIGWLIFALLQTLVALIGILPASLLGLAAGAVYGVALGFGLSAIGIMLGAAIAFALTRSALRPAIAHKLAANQRLARLDHAVGRDGWRLVLLMRVSPVMPFSLTSYALGLSAISPRDYALGTLAALPALLLYVAIGTLSRSGLAALHGHAPIHLVLVGVAIIATGLLSLRLGRLIANALRGVDH